MNRDPAQVSCETHPVTDFSNVGAIRRSVWVAGSRWSLGIVAGFALMALASQVKVPFPGTPVPGTLQLLAVLLVGFLLRPSHAVSTMLLYLIAGSCGLGVFSAGSAGLSGVTAGFLVGFPVSAWVVSLLASQKRASFLRLFLAGGLGTVCLFSLGVSWITVMLNVDVTTAIRVAVSPFALKAVVELIIAVSLVRSVPGVRRLLRGGGESKA